MKVFGKVLWRCCVWSMEELVKCCWHIRVFLYILDILSRILYYQELLVCSRF